MRRRAITSDRIANLRRLAKAARSTATQIREELGKTSPWDETLQGMLYDAEARLSDAQGFLFLAAARAKEREQKEGAT